MLILIKATSVSQLTFVPQLPPSVVSEKYFLNPNNRTTDYPIPF